MTCRPATCVRKRDPQHPVSSPKIHRRSPIHSSLPSHRCAAVSTRMIVDGFLPGRREAVAFIRRVTRDAHKDQRSRRRPSRLFASASDARRALFFRSVRQEKFRPPRPPSRVGVPLAPKKHRPRLFSTAHPPLRRQRARSSIYRDLYLLETRSLLSMASRITLDTSHWHAVHTRLFTRNARRGARARAQMFSRHSEKKRRSRAFKNVPLSTKLRPRVDPPGESVERQRVKLAERRERTRKRRERTCRDNGYEATGEQAIGGRDREIPHHSLPAAPAPSPPLHSPAPLPPSSFAPRSRPRYSAFKAAKHPPRMSLVSSTLVLTGAIAPSQLSRVT